MSLISIKENGVVIDIHFSSILYIEAADKYVRIVTTSKLHLVRSTMNTIEKLLPEDLFCRVHRCYTLPINRVRQYVRPKVQVESRWLPVGRQYQRVLKKRLQSWKIYKNG